MKLMVIGGGGREHAIIKSLKKSDKIEVIYALPGNGGIAEDATCVDIAATDIPGAVQFAKDNAIDFCVVAPDDPLVLGMVDPMTAIGVPCFGPDKKAAIIEGSKVFSKDLMRKYNIPTAEYAVFDNANTAIAHLDSCRFPIVIKADGLALGKGVLICDSKDEAIEGIKSIMQDKQFGTAGDTIVIEEFLTGPEVSVLAFTDGSTVKPMVSSMDHKRAHDNDEGLNTGGMGTIAPNPCYTDDIANRCMDEIFLPTINAMKSEGRPFKGCLYFGLILTENGPKVIEYNCRFGDPEAQVVLPLLKTDLLDIMLATANGTLEQLDIEWSEGAACCVMVVSGGYPESYKKGYPIDAGAASEIATLYHSGTALKENVLVTNGGRVIGVTAIANDLETAITKAYEAAEQVKFEGAYMRHDIGKKALESLAERR